VGRRRWQAYQRRFNYVQFDIWQDRCSLTCAE
jgi:hypothetical protein